MSLNLAIELERLFFRAICLEVFLSIIDREKIWKFQLLKVSLKCKPMQQLQREDAAKGSLGDGRIDVLINSKVLCGDITDVTAFRNMFNTCDYV